MAGLKALPPHPPAPPLPHIWPCASQVKPETAEDDASSFYTYARAKVPPDRPKGGDERAENKSPENAHEPQIAQRWDGRLDGA